MSTLRALLTRHRLQANHECERQHHATLVRHREVYQQRVRQLAHPVTLKLERLERQANTR